MVDLIGVTNYGLYMFVLTIDQRGSRTHGDKVPELLTALSSAETVLPFERTVGDEVQGVMADPKAVVDAVARVLRQADWYIGIGLGRVDLPLPASSRAGSGDAFIAARAAVEAAKKRGQRLPLCVRAPQESEWAEAAEAVLVLFGDLVRKQSLAERRVLDALDAHPDSSQADVALALKVSPQAVSKAIARSGRQEEEGGRRAAALLLRQADLTLNA